MAQKVQVVLVDDLDGSAGPTVETVSFGLDGTHYEIDLSKKNAQKLRTSLSGYLTVARATKAVKPKARPKRATNGDARAIRQWAASNGIEVPEKGRVPQAVKDQYAAAN